MSELPGAKFAHFRSLGARRSAISLPRTVLVVFLLPICYLEERANWFPSWSLKTAPVPQDSVFGSITKPTPLLFNTFVVAWTSSLQNVTGWGLPM